MKPAPPVSWHTCKNQSERFDRHAQNLPPCCNLPLPHPLPTLPVQVEADQYLEVQEPGVLVSTNWAGVQSCRREVVGGEAAQKGVGRRCKRTSWAVCGMRSSSSQLAKQASVQQASRPPSQSPWLRGPGRKPWASVRAPGTNLQEPAVAGEVERGREQLGRRRAGDGPGRRAGTSSILRSLTFHHLSPAPHTGTAGAAATLPITASDTAAAAVAAAALAPVPPPPRPPPDAALTPRGCRTDPPPPAARRRPRRGRSHLPG